MNSLAVIKAELERINEARAFNQKECSKQALEDCATLSERFCFRYGAQWQHDKLSNEITNLTKALSVAVHALDNHVNGTKPGYTTSEEALETIAEILSGGGDKK